VRALAGLGNPGDNYSEDRHNAGWMLLDALLRRSRVVERRDLQSVELRRVELHDRGSKRKGKGGEELWLMRPTTYMNRSGVGVSAGCSALGIGPDELVVAYDDIDLPLATLRIRPAGGDGGHRGMRSIIRALGTQQIPRLRIGIRGIDAPLDTADYVLSRFKKDELETIAEVIEVAADAVQTIQRSGLTAAMNAYNKPGA
jgi:PTH1 family peptidyl-tRNA hydrolase